MMADCGWSRFAPPDIQAGPIGPSQNGSHEHVRKQEPGR
jgi:hypothetical protein